MTEQNKKIAMYGAAALGIGIAAFFIFKPQSSTPGNGGIYDPTGNGGVTNPGQTVFNPSVIAERLYTAMVIVGTDEDEIFNALAGLSEPQYYQVAQKFGKRSYNSTTGTNHSFNPFTDLPLEPLKVWLKNELSTSDYETLRKRFPNYL